MCASLGLRMKCKTLFMSEEENTAIILIFPSFLICPSNSRPLGFLLLKVFKLVPCKLWASRRWI